MNARDDVLGRIRRAVSEWQADVVVPRTYRRAGEQPWSESERLEVLADRLVDYRAGVEVAVEQAVPGVVAGILQRHGVMGQVVVPAGYPAPWLPRGFGIRHDEPPLSASELDDCSAVLTTCAVAIAETGTIVLDGGPGMGRRVVSLIPDLHVVVVRAADVVRGVPEALSRLRPDRPLTWISGPSATSDIELDRVEGVHGPRRLEIVLTH